MILKNLKSYAEAHHVPIISDDGLLLLKDMITKHHVKDVLEIGTAIGYSAIAMALLGLKVDTIERDDEMVRLANKHIEMANLNDRIKVIHQDATTHVVVDDTYDMIFIDAAKVQYKKLFEMYTSVLRPEGIIICDNLHFHHLDPNKVNKHTRRLLLKMQAFIEHLKTHPHFDTTLFDVGDGISVSKRK